MMEPYGAASDPNTGASASSGNSSGSSSILACYACKRRKVKCNRELPVCSLCQKLNGECVYPTHPEKPGPKTGSLQRAKRRKLDSESVASTQDVPFNAPRQSRTFDPIRNTTTSPVGGYYYDGPPRPRPFVATNDGPDVLSPGSSSTTKSQPTAPIFSTIMYPSHESHTRPTTPTAVEASPGLLRPGQITVDSVCAAMKITRATYDMLMDSYFTNMTSFSLFRPGSIEPKFALMQNQSEAEALVASMFSVSARHCCDAPSSNAAHCPSASYFSQIASAKFDESVDRYGDVRPPFWLLQAGILVTFYQLTLSVRSRSWRKLGDLIRCAYELHLHIVDANHDPESAARQDSVDLDHWVKLEERRRAWWAIWEMDVFASTLRRLPTAIYSGLNLTLLPVSDGCWFNNVYQDSCFLVEDCDLRWKHLAESGNQSAKAWFIVINSLMRNTYRIVYNPAGSAVKALSDKHAETSNNELNIMANCLYCTISSLPACLSYQGENLDFHPRSSPYDGTNARQEHADIYSIHLMTQLWRFMIYHHKICARAPWQRPKGPAEQTPEARALSAQENSEWNNYMSAADEIVLVVRNSSRDHYKYVNPCLANTLWFAAAAQCACRVFGPPNFNKRMTSSNLELVKLTIDRFISFWNGTENLKGKLARIEVGLKNLMSGADGNSIYSIETDNGATEGSTAAALSPSGPSAAGRDMVGHTALENGLSRPSVVPGPAPEAERAVQQFAMQVQDSMSFGVPPNAWGEPVFAPDMSDFVQPFNMTGGFFPSDPTDLLPFGLEELLMSSMVQPM